MWEERRSNQENACGGKNQECYKSLTYRTGAREVWAQIFVGNIELVFRLGRAFIRKRETASQVAKKILEEIVSQFGLPVAIRSDNGPVFDSSTS